MPNLKALRAGKGISQQKLAEAIGTSQQAINRYENQNVELDISTLIKFADFFETTVDYLIGRQIPANAEKMIAYDLSKEEAEIIDRYRALNGKQQDVVGILLDSYQTRG